MEPFFFGNKNEQLLGLYHSPTGDASGRGVLICPPILGDYMRTHGCLRLLAITLADAGFPVLRFDYSGTGDSHGDLSEGSILRWKTDLRLAAKELQAISGASSITVVSLRFGALLALAAMENQANVDRLVLWDPVFSGTNYIAELGQTYKALIGSHESLKKEDSAIAAASITGYDIGDTLKNDIARLVLPNTSELKSKSISVLLNGKSRIDADCWRDIAGDISDFDHEFNWGTYSESVIFGHEIVPLIVQKIRK